MGPAASSEPAGALPKGYIRAGPFAAIPDMLRLEGVDPEAVLAASGLDKSALSRSENVIPYPAAQRLLAIAAAKTGLAEFGLQAGQRVGIGAIGVLGMAMQNCCNLGEALSLFSSHYQRHDGAGALVWLPERPVATISYSVRGSDLAGSAQSLDFALAIGLQIMKSICGPQWRPIDVQTPRPPPPDPARYRALAGVPVRFRAADLAISFDASWLDRPLAEARPALRDMLLGYFAAPGSEAVREATDQVRRVLRVNPSRHAASLIDVALALNVHPRTLARRLKKEGATFKSVANEIRHETALQFLEQTAMPIAVVAMMLGYADVASFSRAFKSRTGMPPKARRTRRSG